MRARHYGKRRGCVDMSGDFQMFDAARVVDHLFGEFDDNFFEVVDVVDGVEEVSDVKVFLVASANDRNRLRLE